MQTPTPVALAPIVIYEDDHPINFQALLNASSHFWKPLKPAFEAVLEIMLKGGLTAVPERKAVWCHHARINSEYMYATTEIIGESFPDDAFKDNCFTFCQEKVSRTQANKGHITSYESRDPKKNQFGGSAQITFELIPLTGGIFPITFIGAPSGLKEWEDLALMLGTLYYLGLIKFENQQVQEILRRAEKAVADDPSAQPKGLSISQYTQLVFSAIDTSLLSAA